MLRSDGVYREDSGAWSNCMLLREDGTGVRGTVSFGVLTHEAARFLVKEKRDFELLTWESAHPPRERSRSQLIWEATEDKAEFKWTSKWTYGDKSGEDALVDVAAILDDGRLLRLSAQRGGKLGTPRDSHFYAIDPGALGDTWGLEDDARLVRDRLESGKTSREGVQLAAALGYEPAAIALSSKPPATADREQVVSAIAALGGGAAVRAVLGLVWDEESSARFHQGYAHDAPKGSAEHKAFVAITKWLQSGKAKDRDKAKELAKKVEEFPDELLQIIELRELTGAELEKALHEFLKKFINKSEEQAFEVMRVTLLPWVLEGRDRYA
ncbi:MAG: hypothetical protein ACOY0T_28900 [Myxococcota bacterium]